MQAKTYLIGKQKLTLAKTSPKQISALRNLMGIESFGALISDDGSKAKSVTMLLDIQCDQKRFDEFIRILTGYEGEPIKLEDIDDTAPILKLWSDFFICATRSV